MAAVQAGVQIKGIYALNASLRKAGADMALMKDANEAAARIVAQDAAVRAPHKSGRLAGSLRPARRVATAQVSSSVIYAGPIHWGWPRRGIRPDPFLTTAVDATQGRWLDAYTADIQSIVAQIRGV